jgi:hypothetical protein
MHHGLEELAHDPEREVALQRRTGRRQHPQPGLRRARAQHPQQRRLALPGGCLEERHGPVRGARGRELGAQTVELGRTLEKAHAPPP